MGDFMQEMFRLGLYKRSQGRIARQVTFAAFALIAVLGAWSLSEYYRDQAALLHYVVPLVLLAVGMWASFRLVQMPNFADFLIAVEGEMNKVSWPSRGELFRAAMVVMMVIFFMAGLLYTYDMVLTELMRWVESAVVWLFGGRPT